MAKKIKLTINFTESDIQEMLDALNGNNGRKVFNWTPKNENGEEVDVLITVGDDE